MELPVGFTFQPSDEELIGYYLRKKRDGTLSGVESSLVPAIDLLAVEPWDIQSLPELSKQLGCVGTCAYQGVQTNRIPDVFFFCKCGIKGTRTERTSRNGYWKASGEKKIVSLGTRFPFPVTSSTLQDERRVHTTKGFSHQRTHTDLEEIETTQSITNTSASVKPCQFSEQVVRATTEQVGDLYFDSVEDVKPTQDHINSCHTFDLSNADLKEDLSFPDEKLSSGEQWLQGTRQTLVYYLGKAPLGKKTSWILHEYNIPLSVERDMPTKLSSNTASIVVCRLYSKREPQKSRSPSTCAASTKRFKQDRKGVNLTGVAENLNYSEGHRRSLKKSKKQDVPRTWSLQCGTEQVATGLADQVEQRKMAASCQFFSNAMHDECATAEYQGGRSPGCDSNSQLNGLTFSDPLPMGHGSLTPESYMKPFHFKISDAETVDTEICDRVNLQVLEKSGALPLRQGTTDRELALRIDTSDPGEQSCQDVAQLTPLEATFEAIDKDFSEFLLKATSSTHEPTDPL